MQDVKRLAPLVAALLAVAVLPASGPAAAAEPTAGQTTFTALDPVRLLDTRTSGPVGPGGTVDVLVADGLRVPRDATSVVLTVTATGATGATDVRAYPTPAGGGAVPTVSNLNLGPGQTVANVVHVPVGAGGRVRLRNASGSVHLLADLSGYHAAGAGTTYVPATPRRLLDTRQTGGPLLAGEVRTLQVAGSGQGAPADARAVVLNVTAVGATLPTDVRVWPTRPGDPPRTSNLNPPPGQETPAAVVVGVGEGGRVSLRSSSGLVHLVVDLSGWYLDGTDAAVFHAVPPQRLLDTRSTTALAPGEARALTVAGAGRVPSPGSAVVLNVTATGATGGTNVRVYPKGSPMPSTSNLNVTAGRTVANAVVATVGADGQVLLRNASGSLHLVVDLAGWFGPAGDGWDISWPQCTSGGGSRLPEDGAHAVIGRTRGTPFTENPCFDQQYRWASSLPGEPAVYLNTNAPGPRDTPDGRVWQEVCGTSTTDSTCAYQYGVRLARYATGLGIPTTPSGGKPFVWMDVEGPYANGPFWTTSVAVNRAVYAGAVETLRGDGYRVGVYTDRDDSRTAGGADANDWRQIMGDWRLLLTQNWVFRVADDETAGAMCSKAISSTGGPAVMVQQQPTSARPEQVYDVDHTC